jgi:hypothetical protein
MPKYAIFDENGLPKAFYDKEIHGENIPKEAIKITDEQWLEFINNQGRRKWDFEKKQVVEFNLEDLISSEELKERLKQQIKSIRKQKENQGIEVVGQSGKVYKFDTSLVGRSNTQGVISAYQFGLLNPKTQTIHWKFLDGSFADLTYDQLKELASFMMDYVEKLFQAERQHYEVIDALNSRNEIKNYNKNQFWPANKYQSKLLP